MTVPLPSARPQAASHLSFPLPSESCHLPSGPGSPESDASGPGPERGPTPIPLTVPLCGGQTQKQKGGAHEKFQVQVRRETST